MKKPFFVMIHNLHENRLIPMMDGEDLAMFKTVKKARKTARKNLMAKAYGYEVFENGDGICSG